MKNCTIENCSKKYHAKGYCNNHYENLRLKGNPIAQFRHKSETPGRSLDSMHRKRFGCLREQVIQRDGEKCKGCGMTRQEHKQEFNCDITVDHIDKQGRNSLWKNHDLKNLQTLCLRCHGHKDAIQSGKYSIYKPIVNIYSQIL